jgi:hypothetical protein
MEGKEFIPSQSWLGRALPGCMTLSKLSSSLFTITPSIPVVSNKAYENMHLGQSCTVWEVKIPKSIM